MVMPILSTKHLTKHFDGVYAVNNLSISFEAGKITGIIGPNGSGKSTLINTLTGMIPVDAGEIVIAGGERLHRVRAHEVSTLGMTRTFQDVKLFEQMPVIDNILVVLTERSIWKSLFEKHGAFHHYFSRRTIRWSISRNDQDCEGRDEGITRSG